MPDNAVIRTRDEALMPISFAEGAVGIGAFLTILTKPPVSQKCQLRLADGLTGQNAGQHQIQHRDAMIQTAGRYAQQRYLSNVGR